MTDEYAAYLQSEAWQQKRLDRLKLAGFRCSACRSKKDVQVHHLTYARIFQEEMSDLLPLCDPHHDAAEKLIAAGKLDRHGDVVFLAAETLRLIAAKTKAPSKPKNKKRAPKPPRLRDRLLSDRSFIRLLSMRREDFKRAVQTMFGRTSQIMGTACALYDHRQRNRQNVNRYGPRDPRDTLRATGARRLRGLLG